MTHLDMRHIFRFASIEIYFDFTGSLQITIVWSFEIQSEPCLICGHIKLVIITVTSIVLNPSGEVSGTGPCRIECRIELEKSVQFNIQIREYRFFTCWRFFSNHIGDLS